MTDCLEPDSESELKRAIEAVLTEYDIIKLNEQEIGRVAELAARLKVAKRQDVLKNFVAAYLRVFHSLPAKDADQIASSSKGRREWEKKIRRAIANGTEKRDRPEVKKIVIDGRIFITGEDLFRCYEWCEGQGKHGDEFDACIKSCVGV